MADRFYCPDPPVDGLAILGGDEARHLGRVRRVATGEVVELFDGRGASFQAEVVALGRDRVELRVIGPAVSLPPPALALTLATAVPKGDHFDWLVDKATELGVSRLVPIVTERSVVDPRSAKMDRLRRAVVEAAKQCRRDRLMDLDEPKPWAKLSRSISADHRLIAHSGGIPIARVARSIRRGESAALAIGPEGGFSPAEVEEAEREGWRTVGLGPTVLRVETAALVASALLLGLADAGGSGGEGGA